MMALAQLVLVEHDTRMMDIAAARANIAVHSQDSIGWNKLLHFVIPQCGEFVSKINLNLKVGAAPEGYRWKHCWPLHFVKHLQFTIGEHQIWETNSEALQMNYLIDGLQVSHDLIQTAPLEATQTPANCLFDFSPEERTRLSTRPHEVSFEPLPLSQLITMKYKFPIVAILNTQVRIVLKTNTLESCLEPLGERVSLLQNQDDILQKCSLDTLYTVLNRGERNHLLRSNHDMHILTHILDFNQGSGIFEKPANNTNLRIYTNPSNTCSAAYIWITDEDGKELPFQVVDNLRIYFNNIIRHDITGFQSRTVIQQQLPHPTLPNTKSQNLYYVSYYSGRRNTHGLEQGVNLSYLQNYSIEFSLAPDTPQRIKINIAHRQQNTLHIHGGRGNCKFTRSTLRFNTLTFFENPDQIIDIPEDEKMCIILHKNFTEGEAVQQCLQCKKIMNSDAITRWLQQCTDKKCAHCQCPYSYTTFRKGKAHLTFVEEEDIDIFIPHQRQIGWFHRLRNRLGFTSATILPHQE